MEYLMTYGWAILIIAVVLGALFQLGVFNSSSFSPRAPPGACQVFRPNGPGTVTNINLMGVCTGQLPQYVGVFNGQTGYISFGNPTPLQIQNSFSISGWFNSKDITTDQRDFFDKGWTSAFAGGHRSSKLYFLALTTSGLQELYGNAIMPPGWNFYTVTYDGTTLNIYANGVFDRAYTYTMAFNNGYIFTLGRNAGGGYYNGILANVQVYNASLSANQVQALYLEGIGGAPMKLQNLIGWWPLNGNSNDYSGNNNNGVPTNVVFTSQYGK